MNSEKKIQNAVSKYLDSVPELYYNKHSERYKKGVPDIIGCYRGHFFAIELKREKGGVIAPLQTRHAEKITKAAGRHLFASSLQQVVDFIENIC